MQLHFQHYGEGKPLIILHGLFGMSDNWVTLARRYADHYSVYTVDLRNHGKSGHHEVFNYEAMVDDLNEFMHDHDLKEAAFLGHSMGGKAAMQFSFDFPDMVTTLIVADISPDEYNHRHDLLIDIMLSVDLKNFSSRSEVEKELAAKDIDVRIRQFLLKNLYWKDRTSLGWKANLEVIGENLQHIFKALDSSDPFTKPTLFIRGSESPYIRDQHLPRIEKLFPGSTLETINGASHWLHAEYPEEFYNITLNFLKTQHT
jgi:esterase